MSLVLMFPGQSSRYAGMLDKLCQLDPQASEQLQRASDLLGRDLTRHYHVDNDAAFANNRDIQVGVFLANALFMAALERRGVHSERSLGLSLGEYNHLLHIRALDFESALRLVDARGAAYDKGPRGAMASIQPIDLKALQEALGSRLGTPGDWGHLEIVNRNSPRQQVIAGESDAVYKAVQYLEDEHYLQPVVIERQVPMHSSRFASVAKDFQNALDRCNFETPVGPYWPNVLAEPIPAPTPAQIRELLARHIHSPVLWQQSIERICAEDPDAAFVEVGAMGVLHGLLHRRWLTQDKYKCDVREDFEAHFEQLAQTLRERFGSPSFVAPSERALRATDATFRPQCSIA